MSYVDQPLEESPEWVCDGPNDSTNERGCGEAIAATPASERLRYALVARNARAGPRHGRGGRALSGFEQPCYIVVVTDQHDEDDLKLEALQAIDQVLYERFGEKVYLETEGALNRR